jgi:hypothetical protein
LFYKEKGANPVESTPLSFVMNIVPNKNRPGNNSEATLLTRMIIIKTVDKSI